ncbi:MAG: glycosyltransferase [Parachlamydiaceae bacterium]
MKTIFIILITCCTATFAFSVDPEKKKTVCLNMIVKNEKNVIMRALKSVLPFIDTWVIVDTGSTDGTQEIIKTFMKDIPGELYERPWKNFAHNRNEALELAKNKADYVLFIDADEALQYADNFSMPDLVLDSYFITIRMENGDVHRTFMVNNHINWKWKGVLHEAIDCKEAKTFGLMEGIVNMATANDGCRTKDPNKHLKDADTLKEALKDEPNNARYMFYLAQCYVNANELELALEAYEARTKMQSNESDYEVFWSYYMMGQLQEFLGKPLDVFMTSYFSAFNLNNNRAEPIYKMAYYYTRNRNFIFGYALSKFALSLPPPTDIGFTDTLVYNYLLLFTFANSASAIERYEEALEAYDTLLKRSIPDEYRQMVINNRNVTQSLLSAVQQRNIKN